MENLGKKSEASTQIWSSYIDKNWYVINPWLTEVKINKNIKKQMKNI